jgi:glycosyltransferase involved in cell wall biosynthesis
VSPSVGVCVVIPTKDRPEKLGRCLASLAAARSSTPFTVHVCDSSTDATTRDRVAEECARHPFAELVPHDGWNVGIARNVCTRAASEELIVSVDDDVRVEPDAVDRLVAAYRARAPHSVVGGSVHWGGGYQAVKAGKTAIKMRRIGYGRPIEPGESPDFLVTALFLYPRRVGLMCPWNERIPTSDDRFVGAVWRSRAVELGWESQARGVHDDDHVLYRFEPEHQHSQIYTNLFDALMANPRPIRALEYEVLGFAAGIKGFGRSASGLRRFLAAWLSGHRQLVRDRDYLRALLQTPPPPS